MGATSRENAGAGDSERDRLRARVLDGLTERFAHDLNNHLVGVTGHADLVLMDLPAGGPGAVAREDVERIRESASAAASLVAQLASLGAEACAPPRSIDLAHSLASVEDLLRLCVPKTVELSLDLARPLEVEGADEQALRLATLLLLLGVSRAMPGRDGALALEVHDTPSSGSSSAAPELRLTLSAWMLEFYTRCDGEATLGQVRASMATPVHDEHLRVSLYRFWQAGLLRF